ncbi:MAG: FGGY-family carbohydrate kinase [Pirellulaceae bacterium]|nr:FGGY-family carbohydrate kinase [Pirellulaceae bacterium]
MNPHSLTQHPLILAIDLGTSGLKAALVGVDGTVVGWESQPVKLIVTPNGGSEQSPADWWQAFLQASGRLLDRSPSARERVVAVCCSTQGEGTIAVDRQGNALGNAILWMDMRGAPCLQRQLRGWINIDGASAIKLLNYVRLTGGAPSMTGKDPAGHMLYIRDCQPDIYRKTHKFLNVLDYMNLRLTGQMVASFDSIVTSWVTDNRRAGQVRYHPGLIDTLGVDRDKLPDLVQCTDVIGPLRGQVAESLGLKPSVQVVAGSIDNTAAAVGSGAVQDYVPHLYIGTSSWIAAHVPFKKTDLTHKLASIPCAVPERYLLIALQATAGGNLTYLRDNIIYHHDELLQEADQPDIFKVLDQMAGRVPPGANGVLYTPWVWGERAPIEDRHVRAGLFNLSLHNTRADIIRSVLEGVAMNSRWLLSPVERFLKRPVPAIHLVGGGAQSDVWCQIFADVMNIEIKQVTDPIGANARGAAWIAAVGLGLTSFAEIPRLVQFRRHYYPDPSVRQLYDDRFEAFQLTYKQLKRVYQRLNKHLG